MAPTLDKATIKIYQSLLVSIKAKNRFKELGTTTYLAAADVADTFTKRVVMRAALPFKSRR